MIFIWALAGISSILLDIITVHFLAFILHSEQCLQCLLHIPAILYQHNFYYLYICQYVYMLSYFQY